MEILILVLLLATNTNIIMALDRSKRMVEAANCSITEHPSVVSITKLDQSEYRYGTGVLVTMKWVVTFKTVFSKDDYSGYKVVAGSNYELPSETVEVRGIARTVIMEGEDAAKLVLVELDKPFVENDRIRKAKLPKVANFVDGCNDLIAVGWGKKKTDDTSGIKKLKNEDKLGDLLMCGNATHYRDCKGIPARFCFQMTGYLTGFCKNDIGFGIFCSDILIGITNDYAYSDCIAYVFVSDPILGIETDEKEYSVNSAYNISNYMDWLHKNTGIEIPSKFYQNATTTHTYEPDDEDQPSTTEEYKKKSFGKSTNPTTEEYSEENSEMFSSFHTIRPIAFIYPLLVCLLRLIL